MFKDLYKQANDKIDTEAARSRVMARLEHRVVPVRRAPRRIQRVAALAACFVLTIAAATVYERFQKQNENELAPIELAATVMPQIAESQAEDVAIEADRTQKARTQGGAAADKAVPDTKATPAPSAEPTDLPVQAENYAADALADETQSITTYSAPEEAESQPETAAQSAGIALAKVSGGGSSSRRAAGTEVSVAEYYEYLGKNIEEEIVLPEGFENNSAGAMFLAADAEGNYVNDEWSFLFQKDDKLVNITTTKNTEDIQAKMSADKTGTAENKAVVLTENEVSEAYLVSGGIGYEVTSIGLFDAELDALLVSLE